MANFPDISPDYGLRKTSKPKYKITQLGDGYEFRIINGLPFSQDPKVFDLKFENISEEESDIIEGFLRSRVADQASFSFTPPGEGFTKTGTYSQSGTTVTITISNHGVAIGDVLTVDYTTGSATDGDFVVSSVTNDNVFVVLAAASATNSGNVSITLSGAGKYVCENWTKTITYPNRATIDTTFREVFEP